MSSFTQRGPTARRRWSNPQRNLKSAEHRTALLHTHQITHRVAAIDAAVGEHGDGPAFAADDLGAGAFGVFLRRGVGDDEFALVEDDELVVSSHQRATAEVRLR